MSYQKTRVDISKKEWKYMKTESIPAATMIAFKEDLGSSAEGPELSTRNISSFSSRIS